MKKINRIELKIDHLIIFRENTVFACCKENGHSKIRLFLIFKKGPAYRRNAGRQRWEILGSYQAKEIRALIYQNGEAGAAVYRSNMPFHAAAKELALG